MPQTRTPLQDNPGLAEVQPPRDRRAEQKDLVWAWDFVHDRTIAGRSLKWLAITDEYTRESLALEVDRSITADKVIGVLANLLLTRGVPKHIRFRIPVECLAPRFLVEPFARVLAARMIAGDRTAEVFLQVAYQTC